MGITVPLLQSLSRTVRIRAGEHFRAQKRDLRKPAPSSVSDPRPASALARIFRQALNDCWACIFLQQEVGSASSDKSRIRKPASILVGLDAPDLRSMIPRAHLLLSKMTLILLYSYKRVSGYLYPHIFAGSRRIESPKISAWRA